MINIRAKEKGRNDRMKIRSEGEIVNQQPSATKKEMEGKMKRKRKHVDEIFRQKTIYTIYIIYDIYI